MPSTETSWFMVHKGTYVRRVKGVRQTITRRAVRRWHVGHEGGPVGVAQTLRDAKALADEVLGG